MASRSLNKVLLIGNLTRDPELRYTPQGTAVCSFGLATNRSWKTDTGELKEEAEFHRLVAWNKLAEICAQFLAKGRRCYVEGRLQTRQWTGQDGNSRQTTEIVIDEMIVLDSRGGEASVEDQSPAAETESEPVADEEVASTPKAKTPKKKTSEKKAEESAPTEVNTDDIPF